MAQPSRKSVSAPIRIRWIVAALIVVLLIPAWLVQRENRRASLNSDLYAAIAAGQFDRGVELIHMGADGIGKQVSSDQRGFIPTMKAMLRRINHRPRHGETNEAETALNQLMFSADDYALESREKSHASFEKLALLLIDSGSPLNGIDRFGNSVLDLAVLYHNHELVKKLMSVNPNIKQNAGLNLQRADLEDANVLLVNGTPPNATAPDGETALFTANREKAELLLQHGANVNAAAPDGRTPLYENCREGNDDLAGFLLTHSALTDDATSSGVTPIMMAAAKCKLELVKRLSALGADVSHKSKNGDTVLHFAVFNLDRRVLPWLLTQSIDVNEVGTAGHTALTVAIQRQAELRNDKQSRDAAEAAINLLKAHGAHTVSPYGRWKLISTPD